MSRWVKEAEKVLKRCGYAWTRANASNDDVYENGTGDEIKVGPSINEAQFRFIKQRAEKQSGNRSATPKRNTQRIKERQAKEREQIKREQVAKQERLAQLVTKRHGIDLTDLEYDEMRAIEIRLRELADMERVMTGRTVGADDHLHQRT